jgi:ABC-type bacteriocin/lantibiotic exporter with double-glycine peptidase domain
LVFKIRQRESHDCGVACLAMAAGLSYEAAHAIFVELSFGKRRARRAPFSSQFRELLQALKHAGVDAKIQRGSDIKTRSYPAILKNCKRPGGNWHWVYAERDPLFGLTLHDPASDIPCHEHPPLDVLCVTLSAYPVGATYIALQERTVKVRVVRELPIKAKELR